MQENGVLTGYNTDGKGYMRAVEDAGYNIIGKKMTILGTGGAAASIIAQAALDGVSAVDVIARKGHSWGETEKVVNRVNAALTAKFSMYELADEVQMRKSIEDSAILVNASSVGMSPHEDNCLVPDPSSFHPELIVSDVIYNPRKTKLLPWRRTSDAVHLTACICFSIREPMHLPCGPAMKCRSDLSKKSILPKPDREEQP